MPWHVLRPSWKDMSGGEDGLLVLDFEHPETSVFTAGICDTDTGLLYLSPQQCRPDAQDATRRRLEAMAWHHLLRVLEEGDAEPRSRA